VSCQEMLCRALKGHEASIPESDHSIGSFTWSLRRIRSLETEGEPWRIVLVAGPGRERQGGQVASGLGRV